ncbi:hypothetical protein H6F95_06135 [Cyanobacteria bacterium FACHB-471]|nr:hypothetical protein [Cyanobacteria bacterium FACHB-471]
MADVDNKLGAARNLGILNASSIRRSDRVGRTDLDDLRRFRLGERRSLNLSLSRITRGANVDVEVYAAKPPLNQVLGSIGGKDFRRLSATERNDNLQLVAASRQSGNQDEALTIASLNPGVYFVRVLRRTGDTPYLLSLADAPVDTSAPTARLRATAPTRGSSTHNFTVTYRDNVAVDVSSLDNRDILVTGPDGFRQSARRIAVNSSSNGATRSATYQLRAPGEAWDSTDNGIYNIFLRSNQVKDTSSNFAASGLLGSFQTNIVDLPSTDRNPPTASLSANNLIDRDSNTYDFTITYSDDVAININSIDSTDVQVVGQYGYNQLANRVAINTNDDRSSCTVTYRVTAPGGTWDSGDNGSYRIVLQPDQVSDTSGKVVATSTLGDFLVDLPRRSLRFSGGSNGPYFLRLNLDTSVQDTDSDPTQGFFPNAIQSFEVSSYNVPPTVFNFGSASVRSFEADVLPIETSIDIPFRRTVYQAIFPSINISLSTGEFFVNTLTFLVGPLSQDDNFVNSLSPLEEFKRDSVSIDLAGRTFETPAYAIVLTNGATISSDTVRNPNGNWFSNAEISPPIVASSSGNPYFFKTSLAR